MDTERLVRRCPRLGGEVAFGYCKVCGGEKTPCFKVFDCWWERFDVVYGGVQKNLAPAGLALVFIRRSTLKHTERDLASYLRYDAHASKNSMYNTPPVFPIYVMEKVLRWIRDRGGLPATVAWRQ